jgi:hypothetical protein
LLGLFSDPENGDDTTKHFSPEDHTLNSHYCESLKIQHYLYQSSSESKSKFYSSLKNHAGGKRWHSWFRHYATSWKVTGSSPDEVDIFQFT